MFLINEYKAKIKEDLNNEDDPKKKDNLKS